jgi:hypothetical protein
MQEGIQKIRQSLEKRAGQLEKEGRHAEAAKLRFQVAEFCEQALLSQTGVNIDSYLPFFFDNMVTLSDYFAGTGSLIVFDEPARIAEEAGQLFAQCEESMRERLAGGRLLPQQASPLADSEAIMKKTAGMRLLLLAAIPTSLHEIPVLDHFTVSGSGMRSYRGNISLLGKDLERWKKNQYRIIIVSRSALRARQLVKDLEERKIYAEFTEDPQRQVRAGEVLVIRGNFRRGIEYPLLRFVILSENDMFGEGKNRRTRPPKKKDAAADFRKMSDLHIRDYVVHEDAGIGHQQRVRVHPRQLLQIGVRLLQIVIVRKNIHGHVHLHAVIMGEADRFPHLIDAEILRLRAQGKCLSPDIDRVRAIADGNPEHLRTGGGDQQFRNLSLSMHISFLLTVTAAPSPMGTTVVRSPSVCFSTFRYSRILRWIVRSLRSTAAPGSRITPS